MIHKNKSSEKLTIELIVERQIRKYNSVLRTALMAKARKGRVSKNDIEEIFTDIT